MSKVVRIANGQGFWGDSVDAPYNLVKYGKIDYLTLDYLAEVTLSIMQRQKLKNPEKGYATDFVELFERIAVDISNKNIKVITNAGGVNPEICREKLLKIAKKLNLNIKIAIIKGDDILGDIDSLISDGVECTGVSGGAMTLSFNGYLNEVTLSGLSVINETNL